RAAGPGPPVRSSRGSSRSFALSAELTRQLQALSQSRDATLFMTLLAAYGALLHRLSGQPAIPVGSPIANRNRAELEPLIGFFANTLVFAVDLEDGPGFAELLGRG